MRTADVNPFSHSLQIMQGYQYWRYDNFRLVRGYPKNISTDWRSIPNDLDAVFIWSGDDETYFVKGK